jgi:hypothetical protein
MNKLISVGIIFLIAMPMFIVGFVMLISDANDKRSSDE